MKIYPYNSPIILTDNLFVFYGGQTGTMSAAQRSAAYLIAERQASNYIGTLLVPTIVTGTYPVSGPRRVVTDYGYVSQVYSTTILSKKSLFTCELQSDSGCCYIWDDTFGYIDVAKIINVCSCSGGLEEYQIQLAYQAGLPTGTAASPDILLALTIAAQINLNEMIYPSANESAGDIGVQSYSSLDYSERRKELKRTIFGTSALANKAANLLDGAIRKARPALVL